MHHLVAKVFSAHWFKFWEINRDPVIPTKWAIFAVANFVLLKQILYVYIIICIYTIFTFKVDMVNTLCKCVHTLRVTSVIQILFS